MILPVGASSFKEAMKMGVEVYHHLKVVSITLLPRSSESSNTKRWLLATNVGDEKEIYFRLFRL